LIVSPAAGLSVLRKKNALPLQVIGNEEGSGDPDCRSAFIRDIDASGAYHIPARSRSAMMDLLMLHATRRHPDGFIRFCWDIRMNFSHDISGRVTGGEELDPAFNRRWMNLVIMEDPTILRQAYRNALAPYLGDDIAILDDPSLRCGLVRPREDRGCLYLHHVNGIDIHASCPVGLREKLEDCDTPTLTRVFTIIRVLDEDTARPLRAHAVAWELNRLRVAQEAAWRKSEPELNFSH